MAKRWVPADDEERLGGLGGRRFNPPAFHLKGAFERGTGSPWCDLTSH